MTTLRAPKVNAQALRDEAFRAVEAIGERHFTPESLEGCIKDFARHIYDLTDCLAERDQRIALLTVVAHSAWHLLDDGGEADTKDDNGVPDFVASGLDSKKLSDALDALEATGWDAHPEAGAEGEPT